MKLLHITAHMGGGAGNAISGIILRDHRNRHSLICLQTCEKRQFIDRCGQNGIQTLEEPGREELERELADADCVILHWWHHPVMCAFLAQFPRIPCRIILWAHISGCTYPRLHQSFVRLFDRVYFTTPYSYENQEWSAEEAEAVRESSDIVYGLGDFAGICEEMTVRPDTGGAASPESADGFRGEGGRFTIGYVGTLSAAKLHGKFIEFCLEIIEKIPEAGFLLVGDTAQAGWLTEEIGRRGLERYFEFTGYCEDVRGQLARMDIFAYPLNEHHFGTTENVVLEAMAAGLPVVLLDQNTEKYIVEHRVTGMLAGSIEEYAGAVYELYQSAELRRETGSAARAAVFSRYSRERNAAVFQAGLERIQGREKRIISFPGLMGAAPHGWFLEGLAQEERDFFLKSLSQDRSVREMAQERVRRCRPVLKSDSKSSVLQFARCYPEDEVLQYWKSLVEEESGDRKLAEIESQ